MARSKAYPAIDLREACDLVVQRVGDIGVEAIDRDELARRFGHESSAGGLAARKIGALVHYGFLERQGNASYTLSRLGAELLETSLLSRAGLEVLRQALETPTLFRRLLELYRGEGRLPGNLAAVLVKDFEILPAASAEAASVFVRSAKFAQVLDARERFFSGEDSLESTPTGYQHSPNVTMEERHQIPPAMEPESVERRGAGVFLKVEITGTDPAGLGVEGLEAFEASARQMVESAFRRLKLKAQEREARSSASAFVPSAGAERFLRGPRRVQ